MYAKLSYDQREEKAQDQHGRANIRYNLEKNAITLVHQRWHVIKLLFIFCPSIAKVGSRVCESVSQYIRDFFLHHFKRYIQMGS